MPDNDIGSLKAQVTKEVKQLAKSTEQQCKKAKPLREEAADIAGKKQPSNDDKKRLVDLRSALKDLEKSYLTQADSASDRINKILNTTVPDDQKAVPEWQKAMAPWYRDLLDKEGGLDLGKDLKLSGDISIKDKKATIILKGKFSEP
jgi:hypothetical protein